MFEKRPLYEALIEKLRFARNQDQLAREANSQGELVDVPGTGKVLSSSYEQLRKAAEYAEEHLLLERAIKRFYNRDLFLTNGSEDGSGRELIVDLVQAGYLRNGTIGSDTINRIDELVQHGVHSFNQLRQAHVPREQAKNWTLAMLAVETENILNPHEFHQAVAQVAHQEFLQSIDRNQFIGRQDFENYEIALFIATHKALLKSDIDITRHAVFSLYWQHISQPSVHELRDFNHKFDQLFNCELTLQLQRTISRYGAPYRVLNSFVEDNHNAPELLTHRESFMNAYLMQIQDEYRKAEHKLNRGLIKSIFFLFITKVIIGVAIEIPYDLLTRGEVIWVPLMINLLFPPLYMASLRLTIRKPTGANARAVYEFTEELLFGQNKMQIIAPKRSNYSFGKQLVFAAIFSIPIVITIWILNKLDFNLLQVLIFFTFFSTASYLGFRLRGMIHDLELRTRHTGLIASTLDFFYLPFIIVGQWLSKKYNRLNLVARFLDVVIELPLKTILRLIRQWIRFLNERHDELY